MKIKTRFAPSSTGLLHFGSARTALYSWLFAKRYNGSFILRVEDTDITRSNPFFIKNILKTLSWLGLNWDETLYLQSERLNLYKKFINDMLRKNVAYKCYCSTERLISVRKNQILNGQKPRYDRTCRNINSKNFNSKNYVVRFKNPLEGQVIFKDYIRGEIIFDNSELDDLVIQRKNGMPTYNFCVVIDDLDMKITHVIRGEDHINNTPRQINILRSLNANIPIYAHVSMIVDESRNNLSKRKNSLSVLDYKKKGFLKESILNYLVKLGWSYGDKEIFTIDEMKKYFSLKSVSKSPSILNSKKLLWLNNYYLKKIKIDKNYINKFKKHLFNINILYNNIPDLIPIIKLLRNRCNTLKEMALESVYFFNDVFEINDKLIEKYFFLDSINILNITYFILLKIKIWNSKNIMSKIKKISISNNIPLKNICIPLRIAITGKDISPSINIIMEIIGKSNSLKRIKKILLFFNKNVN